MRALRCWIGRCLPLWAAVGWVASLLAADAPPAVVPPGENLIVDGIPPIPAEIVDKAGRYGEARGAILNDWHPTRPEMLVTTRFGDTNQLFVVKQPGGSRTQITFFPDRVEGGLYDPIRGDYVVLHKGVGGAEFFQNYRYDFATGDLTLLTDGRSRNSMVTFSHDGSRAAYTSTRRNGTDTDLYLQFPLDPKTDRLVAECRGGGWEVLDWSPDGKNLLVQEEISVTESYLWLVEIGTGEKRALTPRDTPEKAAYGESRFTEDGRGVLTITDQGREFRYLAYLPLGGGRRFDVFSDPRHDVTGFDLSRDGEHLAIATNEDGLSRLWTTGSLRQVLEPKALAGVKEGEMLLDRQVGSSGPANSPALIGEGNSGGVLSAFKWSAKGDVLGYSVGTAQIPSDCFAMPYNSGVARRWTFSETGGLPPGAFMSPQLVRWPSFDGQEISGFLYAPEAGKFPGKRPVIVNIHGGPESQYRPGFLGRNNYLVNELGCTLIFPNVRGSSGFGKKFVGADDGFKREDSYKDVAALFDWIKAQPGLDADRIMVTGGSYGGHVTLAVAAFYADRIRCAVDVVGMSNLKTFLEHTESYRRDLRRVEYGDERDPKMAEFLERIAPMNNAARITKPMFVVQGYNDPRVPRSEAEQIVATLKKQATPVWFLMARDEGHGFAKKKNADFQFYATVGFIRRYLLEAK